MWISRVRVNGGFLAGLDLSLSEGLNVVVGPRGSGKTTLLELIRHALGVAHADAARTKDSSNMLKDLLGTGEVILDLQDQDASYHVVVDRTGQGRDPATSSAALILGQNELERIASNANSRLSLIDLRAGTTLAPPDTFRPAALTAEMAALKAQIETASGAQNKRQTVRRDRESAAGREAELLQQTSSEMADRRSQLQAVEDQGLQVTQHLNTANRLRELIDRATDAHSVLAAEVTAISLLDLGVELAEAIDRPQTNLIEAVDSAGSGLDTLRHAAERVADELSQRRHALQLTAQPIRADLESAEAGLGQVTAELRNLDAELADLDADIQELAVAQDAYERIRQQRNDGLDEYESWQEDVYQSRLAIAQNVSADLEQHVVINVDHLSNVDDFKSVLVALLQGSGLQYRQLADKVAGAVLPRQLLRLIEDQDAEQLSSLVDIPLERAARLIGALQNGESLQELASVHVTDQVDFLLMTPAGAKTVESLSTGQKCAVTLPIALTEPSRILVLDQPEDHLDNAYLVRNVLKALDFRGALGAQTIVATHNANIPVLGSAETVASLDSDGARGVLDASGPYDQDEIVKTITNLMEGGRQAFLDRANFYSEHPFDG